MNTRILPTDASRALEGMDVSAAELKERAILTVSVGLMIVGGLGTANALPDLYLGRLGVLVYASLLALGGLAYLLREHYQHVSQGLLVLGPMLSLLLAMRAYSVTVMPFFAVLAVVANAAIDRRSALGAAALGTLLLVVAAPREMLVPSVVLLAFTAALEWVSSRRLHTALGWAWNSQERANKLLDELRARQGELNQTLEALTEATRRLQRTGRELAVAKKGADEARRMKEQFAANISHELRTPLNLILGFSETMHLTPDVYGPLQWPQTLRRDVLRIYQSSRQLLDLINDVLDLAQVDHATLPLRTEQADLGATIHEAVATSTDLLRGRDIALRVELPQDIPQFPFDRARIRQVLLNLLGNAARFTEKGAIGVAAEATSGEVVVSVSDTGMGIPAEKLTRIFDEFYQLDMSLRRRNEGAGLGLAISKRFVELHGGRIWAESQPGLGSTFRFSLPLSPQGGAYRLVAGRATEPTSAKEPPGLVVVDSDAAVGDYLARSLSDYRVWRADDLAQARTLVDQWHPKALLVNMPPHALRASAIPFLPRKVPALYCSLPSQSWLQEEAGVREVLTKPITREQLLGTLGKIAGARYVLVVDDDRGFVQLVERFLGSTAGAYTCGHAYDGAEALARIRERRPDVMLVDLAMPEQDGLQLLRALRADETLGDIPAVIVTARSYPEEVVSRGGSAITLARQQGFSAREVSRYVQALLELTETEYPADSRLES